MQKTASKRKKTGQKPSVTLMITCFRLTYNLLEVIILYTRIRDLREDKDLNQTAVAKMLGMSQTGYSKYETGENDIPTAVLIKLADLYNVSIDYILGQTDNPIRNK